eukprot:422670-Pyramimonas_sp.AAC.1
MPTSSCTPRRGATPRTSHSGGRTGNARAHSCPYCSHGTSAWGPWGSCPPARSSLPLGAGTRHGDPGRSAPRSEAAPKSPTWRNAPG